MVLCYTGAVQLLNIMASIAFSRDGEVIRLSQRYSLNCLLDTRMVETSVYLISTSAIMATVEFGTFLLCKALVGRFGWCSGF